VAVSSAHAECGVPSVAKLDSGPAKLSDAVAADGDLGLEFIPQLRRNRPLRRAQGLIDPLGLGNADDRGDDPGSRSENWSAAAASGTLWAGAGLLHRGDTVQRLLARLVVGVFRQHVRATGELGSRSGQMTFLQVKAIGIPYEAVWC
jgi:hypothetical protein